MAQNAVQQADPIAGTSFFGLADHTLPVDVFEEGPAGAGFGIRGVNRQSRNHVVGIAWSDLDDALKPPGSGECAAESVRKPGGSNHEVSRAGNGSIDQFEQEVHNGAHREVGPWAAQVVGLGKFELIKEHRQARHLIESLRPLLDEFSHLAPRVNDIEGEPRNVDPKEGCFGLGGEGLGEQTLPCTRCANQEQARGRKGAPFGVDIGVRRRARVRENFVFCRVETPNAVKPELRIPGDLAGSCNRFHVSCETRPKVLGSLDLDLFVCH